MDDTSKFPEKGYLYNEVKGAAILFRIVPAISLESGISAMALLGAYTAAGTLGMFLWDLVTHLGDEYELFLKQRVSFPTIVYFWCSLVIGVIFFATTLEENCFFMTKALILGFTSVTTSTSLLLLLCVRAFYMHKKKVILAFFISFFLVTGMSLTSVVLGVGENIALSGGAVTYCNATEEESDVSLAQASLAVWLGNNIAIFLAVAIRLMPNKDEGEASAWYKFTNFRVLLRGEHLPELSRALWWDCQKYIVVFTFTSVVVLGVFLTEILPDFYGFVLIGPHIAIQNCMISSLIRNVRAASLNPNRNMNIFPANLNFPGTGGGDVEPAT
ncbi:hypothetical protein VNI00_013536 [Paramarasmius palmivorus]|uniref:Uncharacterized protein n=1 Tax=Paramarasmius palmivorus TaxID=297713 RepID=A0AAW0BXN6_9AGAR